MPNSTTTRKYPRLHPNLSLEEARELEEAWDWWRYQLNIYCSEYDLQSDHQYHGLIML